MGLEKDSKLVEDSEAYDSMGKQNLGMTQDGGDDLMLRRIFPGSVFLSFFFFF